VGDWAIFQGSVWQKVDNTDSVVSVNGFTGAVSLTTSNISEGSNLYYTNARTIASSLTGYVSGAGTISASDTILTAIQKLNGNIGSLTTGVSSVFGRTGAVVAATGDYTTSQVTEASNLYFTNLRAQSAISLTTTGTSGAATLVGATLNIPQYSGGSSNYKSTTDSASFIGLINTAVYTQAIAANTYAANDIVRITYRTRKTGTGGNQSIRIYFNTTADLLGTPIQIGLLVGVTTTNLYYQMQRNLVIKNATNLTEAVGQLSGASQDSGNYNASANVVINWTAAGYIVFAIQNSNATDVNFGSMFLIEKL
jgi:hypothetical protein